jgi:endonuclease YncB( thermonuclease family)
MSGRRALSRLSAAAAVVLAQLAAGAAAAGDRPAPDLSANSPHHVVRDVTPPSMVRVYRDPKDIPDAIALPPLSESVPFLRAALPAEETSSADANATAGRLMFLSRAGVRPDGAIIGADGPFRLHGIAMPSRMKVCTTTTGRRWACGQRAYIALHNRIAGRPLACEIRDAARRAIRCRAGGDDLSVWLVRQGLVEVSSGQAAPELAAAQEGARTERLGIWSALP